MKKVTILLLDGCTPIVPVGSMELLKKAAIIHQQNKGTKAPFFDIEVVGVNKLKQSHGNGMSIVLERAIDEVVDTDILLIPAIEFDVVDKLEANKSAIEHIKRLYDNGADVGSMCTGAFMLAKTGLLEGKKATTHWYMADVFRTMFNGVTLEDERSIIDNGRLFMCGGATSFINLTLYIVEKYCGKDTAIAVSKMLLIDYKKPLQSSYAMFIPQLQHNDEEIAKVQDYLHAKGKLESISNLAERSNMSLSTFQRKFKKATGDSPLKYMQRVLVEKAKDYLEHTDKTVDEIILEIGYNDASSFRSVFHRYTGFSLSGYKERYSTQL